MNDRDDQMSAASVSGDKQDRKKNPGGREENIRGGERMADETNDQR